MSFHIISRALILVTALFLVTSVGASAQALRFFDDEELFNNICSALALEDFEDTNVPDNNNDVCPNPFDSSTNNACYSTGALIPGFSLSAINPFDGLIVITPPAFDLTNVAVGPNNTNSDTVITFTEVVNAVGMELVSGASDMTVLINVFGAGDVFLGSITADVMRTNGTFVGIVADEQITRIELVDGLSELLYNLSFGSCSLARPIPTLSEWGLIAMAGVLGVIGLLAIRRRKVTA